MGRDSSVDDGRTSSPRGRGWAVPVGIVSARISGNGGRFPHGRGSTSEKAAESSRCRRPRVGDEPFRSQSTTHNNTPYPRKRELLAELGKPYAERSEKAKQMCEWERTPKDFVSAKRFDSQLVAAGGMASDAVHRFDCDTCTPGNRVRLIVCNMSDRPMPFAAVLEGRTFE